MNKKLFGTLLLGSLLMGGTFVSCKDYDDDIKDLQEQISNLATKSDVETKLGQLQSALTAAQQKAEEALAAAKNSAEVKALSEKLDKIAEAQAAVNEALEATKNEVSEQLAEFDEATKQMIADAQKKAEETVGKVADYVTHIAFVSGEDVLTDIQFMSSSIKKANAKEFGKNDEYADKKTQSANSTYEYVKGAWVKSPYSLIVRVDPANAQLSTENVKIVDTKGNDLSAVVEVDNVIAFDEVLTKGATGLWQINLKAVDGIDDDKLKKATTKDGNEILYAIAVNNTLSTAEERFVMTDYSITFDKNDGIIEYEGETNLEGAKISTSQNVGEFNDNNVLYVTNNNWVGSNSRNWPIFAANGETITVEFPKDSKADRFYVVRADDMSYEVASNVGNAWKSYSYEGLGEIKSITDGEKLQFKVTIPEGLDVGTPICFRLYAVNRDGSYVLDNDGHAHGKTFWVHVGKKQNNASSVVANITAQSAAEFSTGWVAYNGTLVDSDVKIYDKNTVTLKVNDNESHTVAVEYAKSVNADGTIKEAPTKNSEVKYIKMTFGGDFKDWTDEATAKGSIYTVTGGIVAGAGVKENVIDVELTKVLPTAEIAKKNLNYSWKAGQLVGGVYTLYAYPAAPSDWTTEDAPQGVKDMKYVLNGLENLDANAYITVANASLEQKPWSNPAEYYWTGTVTANQASGWNLTIDAARKSTDNLKLIDNTTKHKSVIGYNFGKISSKKVDGEYVAYTINVEEFETVFACPLDVTVQTLAWKKYEAAATQTLPAVSKDLNVITYNEAWSSKAQDGTPLKLADYLIATNAFDNVVFGGAFSTVSGKYVQQFDVKLVSNETGNADYFTVSYTTGGDFTFTPQSGTTNPAADVPSTLKITLKDCFGHKNEYSLPFTVKRAQ